MAILNRSKADVNRLTRVWNSFERYSKTLMITCHAKVVQEEGIKENKLRILRLRGAIFRQVFWGRSKKTHTNTAGHRNPPNSDRNWKWENDLISRMAWNVAIFGLWHDKGLWTTHFESINGLSNFNASCITAANFPFYAFCKVGTKQNSKIEITAVRALESSAILLTMTRNHRLSP